MIGAGTCTENAPSVRLAASAPVTSAMRLLRRRTMYCPLSALVHATPSGQRSV